MVKRTRRCITNDKMATQKFKVATVSSQSEVVLKPTSTPKSTKKLEKKKQLEQVTKPTNIPKATQKPKTIKVKKAVKVAEAKNSLEKKVYSISAEILRAYASLSAYDRKLIEKMVYAESRGEPYEGKVAVASVILNRYIFNKMKISIEEIVTAKYQFADISNVTQEMLNEYPDCKKAVEDAIKGNDPTREKFSEGARYFYRPEWVSEYQCKIREGVPVLIIGHHHFHNDFNE